MTPKQQKAVNRAPQAQRAALTAQFQRQVQQGKQPAVRGRQTARRMSPPLPPPVPKAPPQQYSAAYGFNAFDKRHLPMDESTAPYTVTNVSGVMDFESSTSDDQIIVVAPRALEAQEIFAGGPLTDTVAVRYDAGALIGPAIPYIDRVRCPLLGKPAAGPTLHRTPVRARLHNLSVQLECLGTNTALMPPGSCYIGTVPNLENGDTAGGGNMDLKTAWADNAIEVGLLKSHASASLVGKPVCLNASIAESISYKMWRDLCVPEETREIGSLPFSVAMEPIVLFIPKCGAGNTVVNFRLTVGQEWCSRHPDNVMLRATQKHHKPSSPDLWQKAVELARNAGPKLAQRLGDAGIDFVASRLSGAGNAIRNDVAMLVN